MSRAPNAWPPAMSWAEPIAYDSNGVICEATAEWLTAVHGPPPQGGYEQRPARAHLNLGRRPRRGSGLDRLRARRVGRELWHYPRPGNENT